MVSRIVAPVGLLLSIASALALAERPAIGAAKRSVAPPQHVPVPKPAPKPALMPAPKAEDVTFLPKAKPAHPADVPLPRPRPVLTLLQKEKGVPAKFLFASKKFPSTGRPQAIGYYPRGCLQGGIELPLNGPHWEIMRPSRDRNWGHPELIRFLKRFSAAAAKATGWPGILIGDMGQPRGGPLPFGHKSHQVGLDVDIWYTPMPDRILTSEERETMSANRMVAENGLTVNKNWTAADAAFVRSAAEQPEVERVLVNAAIKKEMCKLEGKHHYAWMSKLRPWYFHTRHIHVRLKCPADSPHCRQQPPVPKSDGCAKKDLAFWFSKKVLNIKLPTPSEKPEKPSKQIMLSDLPKACTRVLNAPAKKTDLAAEER